MTCTEAFVLYKGGLPSSVDCVVGALAVSLPSHDLTTFRGKRAARFITMFEPCQESRHDLEKRSGVRV